MYTQDRLHYDDRTVVQFRQEEPFYHVFEVSLKGDLAGMSDEDVLQAGLRQLMGRIDSGQRTLDLEARVGKLEDQVKALMSVDCNKEAICKVARPRKPGATYYEGDLVEDGGDVYKVTGNHVAQEGYRPKDNPGNYLAYTDEGEAG